MLLKLFLHNKPEELYAVLYNKKEDKIIANELDKIIASKLTQEHIYTFNLGLSFQLKENIKILKSAKRISKLLPDEIQEFLLKKEELFAKYLYEEENEEENSELFLTKTLNLTFGKQISEYLVYIDIENQVPIIRENKTLKINYKQTLLDIFYLNSIQSKNKTMTAINHILSITNFLKVKAYILESFI
jgi:hypothetical protein